MNSLAAARAPSSDATEGSRSRLIEHYIRFVLRDEGGPIRDRLHCGLVELALKTGNPDHAMTEADIQARISHFGNLPSYPIGLVSQSLHSLLQRGAVLRLASVTDGKHLYRLAASRFQVVDQALGSTDAQDQDFRNSVVQRLEQRHGHLSRDDSDLVSSAFTTFVGHMLESLGERCANRLIQERSGEQLNYPSIQDDLHTAVRGLPVQLQEDACSAFEDVLRQPSSDEAAYLYSAGQVFYIAKLLNVDPTLQNLQRVRFEKTTLFLDTNLLLPLVHPSDNAHQAVSRMASFCRTVGFTLTYAEGTAEEMDSLVTAADHEFRTTPAFDPASAAQFAPLVENPILRAWLESFAEHRASWSQYRARIGAWRDVLSEKGIDSHAMPRRPNSQRYHQLKSSLSGVRRSRSGEARGSKRPRAVEHDAELISAIEALVSSDDSEPDPFGPRYWLITRDRHLVECARGRQAVSTPGVAMLADEWVQYIAPFLSPDTPSLDPATTFAELLSSRFVPSLAGRMSLSDLRLFTEPKVAELTAGLSQDEACRAISHAHMDAVSRAGSDPRDDQFAVVRLADLAERKLKRKLDTGELIEAEELNRLRRERESETQRFNTASAEHEDEIAGLKAELEATRVDQRTSLAFRWRTFHSSLRSNMRRTQLWISTHRVRTLVLASAVIAAAIVFLTGIGGTFVHLGSVLLIVLPLVATDFEQASRNFSRASRWLRPSKRKRG